LTDSGFRLGPVRTADVPDALAFSLCTLIFADKDKSRLLLLSKIPAEAIDKFSGKKVELVSLAFDEEENLAAKRSASGLMSVSDFAFINVLSMSDS
jgi:hypothetical protein